MDWRHDFELQTAFRQVGLEFKNLCTWVKDNWGQGSFYRSRHELVFVAEARRRPHLNTFELGQHGRYRTNVWEYPGVNTLRKGRLDELSMHPTVKPVALVADAIRDCSKRGTLMLDPFSGSGTTIIAAEVTGRRAHAIEYEDKYVDVAVRRRWQTFTGKHAILAETRQTFEALEEERLARTSAHFAARSGASMATKSTSGGRTRQARKRASRGRRTVHRPTPAVAHRSNPGRYTTGSCATCRSRSSR